jgi:hypothetical protein
VRGLTRGQTRGQTPISFECAEIAKPAKSNTAGVMDLWKSRKKSFSENRTEFGEGAGCRVFIDVTTGVDT